MKKTIKSMLLLVLGLGLFCACSDDRDENPTLVSPTTFVLNSPALAENTIDLANSSSLELTCSQPDYGFPANTRYYVQVAFNENMSDFRELSEASSKAKINVDAATLASTLTDMKVAAGKTEADFPMDIPVYVRVRAVMTTSDNKDIEGTEILSNVIKFNNIHLLFSLPPVVTPEKLYLVGDFNGWDWNSSLEMVPVNGATNVFWHMVYINDKGVKFNMARAWDGNEKGFEGINISGDLAGEIINEGGNIASSNPGWYLMVVATSVVGRDIVYDVQFNKPEVYLMGTCIGDAAYTELNPDALFTVPTAADGEFVSPAFTTACPGGDGDGVRAYVKIPGYDWWKSEFIVFDEKILYRGNGGDQARVAGEVGAKLYLNFGAETGKIK